MINNKTYVIVLGGLVLVIFAYVSFVNILPNNSSNSYLSSDEVGINASIDNIRYEQGRLIVNTLGNAKKGCIKSTRSKPESNSRCWIEVNNNSFSTSIFRYKKYYIWIMDSDGAVSNYYEYSYSD